MTWLGLALLGLAWLALRRLYRRRALSRLPGISDDEFLRRFAQRFSAPPDLVLEERRRISRGLGVPERQLAPEDSYEELARKLELLGDLGIAWDDLEQEVRETARRAGKRGQASAVGKCPTVGDLIAAHIRARAPESPAEPGPPAWGA